MKNVLAHDISIVPYSYALLLGQYSWDILIIVGCWVTYPEIQPSTPFLKGKWPALASPLS